MKNKNFTEFIQLLFLFEMSRFIVYTENINIDVDKSIGINEGIT